MAASGADLTDTTKGAEHSRKLWHRGVFAPGFRNGLAKSHSKCGGLTLMLRAEHYTCVLPPTAGDPPNTWLREIHESIDRDWVAGGKHEALTTPRKTTTSWGTRTPSSSTPRWGHATPTSNKQPASPSSNCGTHTPSSSSKAQTAEKATHNKRAFHQLQAATTPRTPRSSSPVLEDQHYDRKKQSPGTFNFFQPATKSDGKWEWTCPHCTVVLTGSSSRNLASKRTSHMKFRHQDIPLHMRGARINRTQIVEADPQLPLEKRGWSCPFCSAGLPPFAGYHQKQVNVRHHYNTKHPRRDTSMTAIQRARQKQYRKNKDSQPFIQQGIAKKKAKHLEKRDARDLTIGNHTFCRFRPDWSTWPAQKQNSTERRGFCSRAPNAIALPITAKVNGPSSAKVLRQPLDPVIVFGGHNCVDHPRTLTFFLLPGSSAKQRQMQNFCDLSLRELNQIPDQAVRQQATKHLPAVLPSTIRSTLGPAMTQQQLYRHYITCHATGAASISATTSTLQLLRSMFGMPQDFGGSSI